MGENVLLIANTYMKHQNDKRPLQLTILYSFFPDTYINTSSFQQKAWVILIIGSTEAFLFGGGSRFNATSAEQPHRLCDSHRTQISKHGCTSDETSGVSWVFRVDGYSNSTSGGWIPPNLRSWGRNSPHRFVRMVGFHFRVLNAKFIQI